MHTVSRTSNAPTNILPSSSTHPNTDTTFSFITSSSTKPTMIASPPSTENTPTLPLTTSIPITSAVSASTLSTFSTRTVKSSIPTTYTLGKTAFTTPASPTTSTLSDFSSMFSSSSFPSTSLSTLKTSVSIPILGTSPTSSSASPTEGVTVGITSTNEVTTSFTNITPASTSTEAMSSSLSPPNAVTVLTATTSSFLSSPHISSTENTISSAVTTFPTLSSFLTTRTSSATSSLTSTLTETTPFSIITSTTPCPEFISITTVSSSSTTPCTEMNSNIPSSATIPLSTFCPTMEMATSPSSASPRTLLPTHVDASTSMPYPTSRPPNSILTMTTPITSNLLSTQRPTSKTWMSTNSATTPPIKETSETSVATTLPPTTRTSPTSTTTQMTTRSRMTTTPGSCDNGGTWDQGQCLCLSGFSGERCDVLDNKCQNGGKWDGLKCLCTNTFYGPLCEFPVEELELDTVDAAVGMEVSVDQEFSTDLNDNTSQAYREFSTAFQNQMKIVYQNVQEFRSVEILALRNGSIVVDYLVLLELPFSLQLESEYEKVKMALKEELQNASQEGASCGEDTLCFKPDSIKVNNNSRTDLTPEAICRRAAAKDYEDFYFPLVEGNRLRCVTKCTSGVEGAIDCHQGQCFLEKSGPACRCFSSDTHWFSGPRCEVAIHWRALVGGLAGAAALLLLLLLALGVFVARSRSRGGSRSGSWTEDRKWAEIWDENTRGTFSNLGFEDDRIVKEENFQLALENVDTNVNIQRPEVAFTSA
ncbi:mucin-3B-like [Elephas maximus indicus]|uniref:mucin-3B-like n=1 Tax=Elephas maximus indicus TaxID=99487 RepID=UPI0021170AF9|nr:mucin-3B-like [Elephas maximus indicus]